jgi:uncharacterized protein (TIRG00374 family)
VVLIYVFNSRSRLKTFSRVLGSSVNGFWRKVLRRRRQLLAQDKIDVFFNELHDDYLALKAEPKLLKRPFWWAIMSNLAEISLFFIVFLALGHVVNPAQLLVAYGVATLAGAFLVTPGGAGGYEALMIFILVASGMNEGLAFAGVLLARVLLLLGTIVSGYIFYQLALSKYGSSPVKR